MNQWGLTFGIPMAASVANLVFIELISKESLLYSRYLKELSRTDIAHWVPHFLYYLLLSSLNDLRTPRTKVRLFTQVASTLRACIRVQCYFAFLLCCKNFDCIPHQNVKVGTRFATKVFSRLGKAELTARKINLTLNLGKKLNTGET